jgi:hypothetical protein
LMESEMIDMNIPLLCALSICVGTVGWKRGPNFGTTPP